MPFDYILLPDSLKRPLGGRDLLEPDCHFFCIAIPAIMGTAGAAIYGFNRPFLRTVAIFLFHPISSVKIELN
jgi:hypothetical protein